MKKYFTLIIALAALTLALVNFCISQRAEKNAASHTDVSFTVRGLLGFFGISNLAVNYALPADTNYYGVMSLNFEDGQLISEGWTTFATGDIPLPKDRRVRAELLWSTTEPKMVWVFPDATGLWPTDLWMKLDGFRFPNVKDTQYEGFTILAFASSRLDHDGKENNIGTTDFATELKSKKHVGAIAIKTFKTREELDAFRKAGREAALERSKK